MDDARILILGATGGIGSALARQLHDAGARLFLAARGEERLADLAAELDDAPFATVDATDGDAVSAVVRQSDEALGGLTGAVNAVGSILLRPAHLTKDAEWRETLALNLDTAFHLVRAATKAMRREGGSIVLFSTAAVRTGLPNHEAIAAAKGGVEGLARAAAATYAGRGIRVNVVAPGLVDTPLASRITGNEAALEASRAMHPLGRIGTPDEVARAAAWLLEPSSSWVTGQTLGVDGGLGVARPQPRA